MLLRRNSSSWTLRVIDFTPSPPSSKRKLEPPTLLRKAPCDSEKIAARRRLFRYTISTTAYVIIQPRLARNPGRPHPCMLISDGLADESEPSLHDLFHSIDRQLPVPWTPDWGAHFLLDHMTSFSWEALDQLGAFTSWKSPDLLVIKPFTCLSTRSISHQISSFFLNKKKSTIQ